MYLRIENPGVCAPEAFTVFGVSTSRGNVERIGQFGSGAKLGTNLCLRMGICPIVFCGGKRLIFSTRPQEIDGKVFNRVFVQVSNRKAQPLDRVVEYGSLDWTRLSEAIREYVSNAIDAAGGTMKGVIVDIVDEVTSRPNKTVVAIPLSDEAAKWFNMRSLYFLHFREDAKKVLAQKILRKTKPDRCLVYRKGVLVRAASKDTNPSLFDYNLGEELAIDECRNMSESSVRDNVAMAVAQNSEALEEIFRELPKGGGFWEAELPEWELKSYGNDEDWQEIWKKVHGKSVVALGISPLTEMATKRGFNVVTIHSTSWYNALRRHGIKGVVEVLDDVNDKGDLIMDPTHKDLAVLEQVWTWLELVGMTNGKKCPPLFIFKRLLQDGTQVWGYQAADCIYIHEEQRNNPKILLEELAHYVTGAYDCTRDFQDFAFRLAANIAVSAGL